MSATLKFDVVSNGAPARRDMAATRGEVERFGRSTQQVGSYSDQSRGRVSRFGSAIGSAAKSFGPLAVAAGGAAILKFGSDALKAASDTQQAFGGVESVFGKNAATVKAWANDAASSVGLARSQYADLATVLGASLKNSGIEDYAAQTNKLISLGGDLAATFGGTTSDAVSALSSLLRGETDPIERYGVSIKQSGVNALLAAQGQSKLTGAARTQAEQQARLKLLTQQTTAAQGAFARESNTAAGAQQRLTARWTNAKDTIGQRLIPIVTRLVTWLSNTIAGTNRTAAVIRNIAGVIRSYATPVIAGYRRGWEIVSKALKDSSGKGDGLGKVIRQLGAFAQRYAPVLGKVFGGSIVLVAKGLAAGIRWVNAWINALQRLASWAGSAKNALSDLASKAASVSGAGVISKVAGALRSESGLARAGGGGFTGGGSYAMAPSFDVTGMQVVVAIDGRQLRGHVVQIVKGEIRENDRRDDGGYTL